MYYVNNFRFGEISKKNAGRFDSEAYSQGSFSFINAITLTEGGFSRRPPLKQIYTPSEKDRSIQEMYRIIPFNVSESISFIVGLARDYIGVFQNINGSLIMLTTASYPSTDTDDVSMTKSTAHEVCFCQYYNRMYFASQAFRPFYLDFNLSNSTFTTAFVSLILNQDAKKRILFTPSIVRDENGKEIPELSNRYLFLGPDGHYYLDDKLQEKYKYELTYPPIQGSSTYIMNYDSYPDNDLLQTKNDYPAIVSIIADSLYFASTKNAPSTLWKSRILGSSQWVKDYSFDSLHDFTEFQQVLTESTSLVDEEDLPMKEAVGPDGTPFYELDSNANPKWFACKDVDGKKQYLRQIYKNYKPNSDSSKFYTDPSCSVEYVFNAGEYAGNKPLMVYDLSNSEQLITVKTNIDFVTTDSCAMRVSFNTGRQDKITFIKSGLDRIIVGTTTGERMLPSSFSAVKNATSSSLYEFGSYGIQPVVLNSSLIFLQKDNLMRELFLYQGYINHVELTAYSKSIIDGKVRTMEAKNTPYPMIYVLMDNGSLRVLTYDKEIGIQSFSRWTSNARIESIATIDNGNSQLLCALVNDEGTIRLCYFDEKEEKDFKDIGKHNYITEVETVYAEVIDNSLTFGRFKKARVMWLRPYKTGSILLGSDRRQLTRTRQQLGSNDYRHTNMGASSSQFSVVMQSVDSEPMTILALSWEVDNGI